MTAEVNSVQQQGTQDKYKSSVFLLEYVLREYDREDSRSKDIHSRIPIFITLATFFGGYIFNSQPSEVISVFKLNYKLFGVYSVLYTICFVGILVSLGIFVWIMCSKKYKRMNIDNFLKPIAHSSSNDVAAYELATAYIDVFKYNVGVNDKKVKLYNFAISALTTSVISYIFIQIVSFFNN